MHVLVGKILAFFSLLLLSISFLAAWDSSISTCYEVTHVLSRTHIGEVNENGQLLFFDDRFVHQYTNDWRDGLAFSLGSTAATTLQIIEYLGILGDFIRNVWSILKQGVVFVAQSIVQSPLETSTIAAVHPDSYLYIEYLQDRLVCRVGLISLGVLLGVVTVLAFVAMVIGIVSWIFNMSSTAIEHFSPHRMRRPSAAENRTKSNGRARTRSIPRSANDDSALLFDGSNSRAETVRSMLNSSQTDAVDDDFSFNVSRNLSLSFEASDDEEGHGDFRQESLAQVNRSLENASFVAAQDRATVDRANSSAEASFFESPAVISSAASATSALLQQSSAVAQSAGQTKTLHNMRNIGVCDAQVLSDAESGNQFKLSNLCSGIRIVAATPSIVHILTQLQRLHSRTLNKLTSVSRSSRLVAHPSMIDLPSLSGRVRSWVCSQVIFPLFREFERQDKIFQFTSRQLLHMRKNRNSVIESPGNQDLFHSLIVQLRGATGGNMFQCTKIFWDNIVAVCRDQHFAIFRDNSGIRLGDASLQPCEWLFRRTKLVEALTTMLDSLQRRLKRVSNSSNNVLWSGSLYGNSNNQNHRQVEIFKAAVKQFAGFLNQVKATWSSCQVNGNPITVEYVARRLSLWCSAETGSNRAPTDAASWDAWFPSSMRLSRWKSKSSSGGRSVSLFDFLGGYLGLPKSMERLGWSMWNGFPTDAEIVVHAVASRLSGKIHSFAHRFVKSASSERDVTSLYESVAHAADNGESSNRNKVMRAPAVLYRVSLPMSSPMESVYDVQPQQQIHASSPFLREWLGEIASNTSVASSSSHNALGVGGHSLDGIDSVGVVSRNHYDAFAGDYSYSSSHISNASSLVLRQQVIYCVKRKGHLAWCPSLNSRWSVFESLALFFAHFQVSDGGIVAGHNISDLYHLNLFRDNL